MNRPFPDKWHVAHEGTHHVEFRRADSTAVVDVTARYDAGRRTDPGGWGRPSSYVVRLRRELPGADREDEVLLERCDSVEEARALAVEFAWAYEARLARVGEAQRTDDDWADPVAAVRDLFGDTLLAVLTPGSDPVRRYVAPGAESLVEGESLDRYRALTTAGATAVVAEFDDARAVVVPGDGTETVLLLERKSPLTLPVTGEELSRRLHA